MNTLRALVGQPMQEVRSGAVTHNRRVARAGGLCEIGGEYLLWGWMREHKPLVWVLLGAVILATYGVVAALQPISEFRQVYAAYSGVFIALALLWGVGVGGVRAGRAPPCTPSRSSGRFTPPTAGCS